MKFVKLTPREKEIYRQGKIAGYYRQKAQCQKQSKAKKERYGTFDVNEAFQKALERSYGKTR